MYFSLFSLPCPYVMPPNVTMPSTNPRFLWSCLKLCPSRCLPKCHHWIEDVNGSLLVLHKRYIWHTNKEPVGNWQGWELQSLASELQPLTLPSFAATVNLQGLTLDHQWLYTWWQEEDGVQYDMDTILKAPQASTYHCWCVWQSCSGKRPFSFSLQNCSCLGDRWLGSLFFIL